jgi:5'-phosphate synthase pdxT subunit
VIIGVLALQGDFALHQKVFRKLAIESVQVRTPQELSKCDGLVIPGGESTTLEKLIIKNNFEPSLKDFASKKVIFGTCAGLILLADKVTNQHILPLQLLNVTVERNAYGRQRESFIDFIELNSNLDNKKFEGVFIRAPKITRIGEKVKILAAYKNSPVFVESNRILGATFHPELTNNTIIHKYFVDKINATL